MSIDIGKAAFSGFGLIGRHPLSVLVWGLVYLIVLGVPSYFVFSAFLPMQMQMMHTVMAAKASGEGPLQVQAVMWQSFAAMARIGPLFWLVMLLSLAMRGVLTSAVLRAVLEPENKGFFYLRLGAQEFWQAILLLVMFFLFGGIAFAGALIGVIVSGVLAVLLGKAAVLGAFLIGLILMIAGVYIMLRLSLAPAMTFHDKTFRLFESWSLTRGHVGALFVIVLILIVLIWVFEIIVGGIAISYVLANRGTLRTFAAAGAGSDPSVFMQSWMNHIMPFIVGVAAVASILSGALLSIFLAPFATAYKQLTDGAAAPATT